jgi:hypothetical protein
MNDQVLQWAEWTRAKYATSLTPLPGYDDSTSPWAEVRWNLLEAIASDAPERHRTAFTTALQHLSLTREFDRTSRYVCLNSLYQLWSFGENELYGDHIGDYERADRYPTLDNGIEWLRAQLTEQVEALPIAKIPDVWDRLGWEVSGSCLVRSFDRGRAILDRAAAHGVLARRKLRQMRGRLLFLAASSNEPSWNSSDAELAAVNWLPGLPAQSDLERFVGSIFILDRTAAPPTFEACSEDELSLYRDAAADVESLHAPHGAHPEWEECAILARCLFALRRFRDAAQEYDSVASSVGLGLKGDERARVKALWSSERAYESGGLYPEAERVAGQLADLEPEDREPRLTMARLRAREGDYVGAYKIIAGFLDPESGASDDWLLSTIKALGRIAEDPEHATRIRALIESQQRLKSGVAELTLQYWPEFAALPESVKDCWLIADIAVHFFGVAADVEPMLSAYACAQYVTAVERLLDAVIFREYAKLARDLPGALIDARFGTGRNVRGLGVRELSGFLLGTARLSFGDMGVVLRHAPAASEEPLRGLGAWLRERHPALLGRAQEIKRLADLRNVAVHLNQPPSSLAAVRESVRLFMDAAISDMARPA